MYLKLFALYAVIVYLADASVTLGTPLKCREGTILHLGKCVTHCERENLNYFEELDSDEVATGDLTRTKRQSKLSDLLVINRWPMDNSRILRDAGEEQDPYSLDRLESGPK